MKKRIFFSRIVYLSIFCIALSSHEYYSDDSVADLMLETSGFILLLISGLGRAWTSAYILGKKDKELVMDGPYSIMRNPLYTFSFLGYVGAGMAFESILLAFLLGVFFFAAHAPAVRSEENKLRALFGTTFDDYCKKVPKFIPGKLKITNPLTISISPMLFSKAVIESSMIMSIFVVAHAIEWLHVHNILPVLIHLP